MSVTFVQEPPDVPRWVDVLESGYQRLVDSINRANGEYNKIDAEMSQGCVIFGINGKHKVDIHHDNAKALATNIITQVGKDLAKSGVAVAIPEDDIPEVILPKHWSDRFDPHSFSPLKFYNYLMGKYQGSVAEKMVNTKVSKQFTNSFGHSAWSYYREPNVPGQVYKPMVENFVKVNFRSQKEGMKGYIGASQGNSLQTISGFVDWNYASREAIKNSLKNLADIFTLANIEEAGLFNFIEDATKQVEAASGNQIPFGFKMTSKTKLKVITITFRKDKLEFLFSSNLFALIMEFVHKNNPDFKG